MIAIRPLATQYNALTATPVIFPAATTVRQVRVFGSVDFHIAIGGAATTSNMPVAADYMGKIVHVEAGEELSVVKATGQADGEVWFTTVSLH